MTATEEFIDNLARLKAGDLGLLRVHAGQRLDESVAGFDLFTGVWWPLRQKSNRAPRREVAWLITKLYACCPIPHSTGDTLARQLRRCRPAKDTEEGRFSEKFNEILILPVNAIEFALRWALDIISSTNLKIDWVRLTNDLSIWEHESIRTEWAEQYLKPIKGDDNVDRNSHDSKP
jgi:CRISPR type I-E-associated protein CasB/Cse2